MRPPNGTMFSYLTAPYRALFLPNLHYLLITMHRSFTVRRSFTEWRHTVGARTSAAAFTGFGHRFICGIGGY